MGEGWEGVKLLQRLGMAKSEILIKGRERRSRQSLRYKDRITEGWFKGKDAILCQQNTVRGSNELQTCEMQYPFYVQEAPPYEC